MEDRIIRTCSRTFAWLIAGLALPAGAAHAALDDRAMLSSFAQARAAASFGALDVAAKEYAQALALSPDNELLAARTMIHALAAGERVLAVRAARVLEREGRVAADVRFLLLTEAVREKDWKAANAQLDAIDQDNVFRQLTPIVRAWITFETDRRKALEVLDKASSDPAAQSYATEHRALMLLALGEEKEGAAAVEALAAGAGGRAQRLRIAGAAQLARKREKELALGLLSGGEPSIVAARATLERGAPLPGAIDGARTGIAEFLVRIAADVAAQRAPLVGLNYARLATFLAPDSSETWLVTSELLGIAKQPGAALAVLDNIAPDDPFAATARDARVRFLVDAGDRDAAIARAEVQTREGAPSAADWTRLGDLYSEATRHREAADAYGKALALIEGTDARQPEWQLRLLRGGALVQAGDWPGGKAELQAAHKLAPDQPVVLNFLGYSQLERRENMKEAEGMVREASRLQPDNPAITDSLGWALYLDGRLGEAIPLLERAAAGEEGDATIHEHLGDAYFTAGRRIEARYAWQAALLNAEGEHADRIRAKIDQGLTPQLAAP